MEELVIRFLHFAGIISLFSLLSIQNFLLAKTIDNDWLKRLTIVDGLYGVSALVTLGAGLMLWLVVGKPSDFYSVNVLFQIKLGLFVFVALISVAPTIYFFKNRKTKDSKISVPIWVVGVKRIELVTLISLPLLAVLMARGIGLN